MVRDETSWTGRWSPESGKTGRDDRGRRGTDQSSGVGRKDRTIEEEQKVRSRQERSSFTRDLYRKTVGVIPRKNTGDRKRKKKKKKPSTNNSSVLCHFLIYSTFVIVRVNMLSD